MNRTKRLKIGYFLVFLVFAFIAGVTIYVVGSNPVFLVAAALVLIIPGRIQGFFYRDFFTGRQLFDKGAFKESLFYSEKFIVQLNSKPNLKHLLWVTWPIYSVEIKAMALNNLGAAYLELGDFENAESQFQAALSLDPHYPIPYFNLAIVNELRQMHDLAKQCAEKACLLGYRQSTFDKVILKAQTLLASIEGR